jgi:hypothetical protein
LKTFDSLRLMAVMKMIGVSLDFSRSRISRAVSKPSSPGICTSRSTTPKS